MFIRLKNIFLRLEHAADDFCLAKFDYLTDLGKSILPDGFWGSGEQYQGAAGADQRHKVCLTIDDGPDPHTTPFLLELFEELQVRATFFTIGARAAKHEYLLEKVAKQGHYIGNHTYTHGFIPFVPKRKIEKEIDQTNRQIVEVSGAHTELFRPPFGVMDERTASILAERGMTAVYWGPVPEDWSAPGVKPVVRRVMRRIAPGALIVLHENRFISRQTLVAAKEIILKARDLGYEFVGVPELIRLPHIPPGY